MFAFSRRQFRWFKSSAISLLGVLVLSSCSTVSMSSGKAIVLDKPMIGFLVLNIQQASKESAPEISLVSKTASAGNFKKRSEQNEATGNYLTLYFLSGRRHIADSVRIAHPLYKHYEYLDANNQLATKDTVVDNANFMVRFQTTSEITHVTISETLTGAGTRPLATIKL